MEGCQGIKRGCPGNKKGCCGIRALKRKIMKMLARTTMVTGQKRMTQTSKWRDDYKNERKQNDYA